MPLLARYASLVLIAALAVFLIWFFAFRNTEVTPGGGRSAGPPPPRPALGTTLPIAGYKTAVQSALDDVRAARSLSGDERNTKLGSAADALEKYEGANISGPAGGGSAQVDNTAIISELRETSPNLDAVESSLSLLLDGLNATSAGTASGDKALSDLRDVLSDPTFNYERDLSPLEKLARWLAGISGEGANDAAGVLRRALVSLVTGIVAGALTFFGTRRIASRWARAGLSAVVGLAVALLVFGVLSVMANGALLGSVSLTGIEILAALGVLVAIIAGAVVVGGIYMAGTPSSRPRALSELEATLGMGAGEARRRAGEAAAAGDYRLAVRYRCLAVLLALDESGNLHFDRTATDREYLFRAPGTLQAGLQPLLDRFEAVWYGEANATAEDWSAYDASAAALEANALAEPRAA